MRGATCRAGDPQNLQTYRNLYGAVAARGSSLGPGLPEALNGRVRGLFCRITGLGVDSSLPLADPGRIAVVRTTLRARFGAFRDVTAEGREGQKVP